MLYLNDVRRALYAAKRISAFIDSNVLMIYNSKKVPVVLAYRDGETLYVRKRVTEVIGGMLRKHEKLGADIRIISEGEKPCGECSACKNIQCKFSNVLVRGFADPNGEYKEVIPTDIFESVLWAIDDYKEKSRRVYSIDGALDDLEVKDGSLCDGALVMNLSDLNNTYSGAPMGLETRFVESCSNKMVKSVFKSLPWDKEANCRKDVKSRRSYSESKQWAVDTIKDVYIVDLEILQAAIDHIKDLEGSDEWVKFAKMRIQDLTPLDESNKDLMVVLEWDKPDFRSEEETTMHSFSDWYKEGVTLRFIDQLFDKVNKRYDLGLDDIEYKDEEVTITNSINA